MSPSFTVHHLTNLASSTRSCRAKDRVEQRAQLCLDSKMKITLLNLLAAAILFSGARGECTHGRLFISDANTTTV
jgi:hypothetical protein